MIIYIYICRVGVYTLIPRIIDSPSSLSQLGDWLTPPLGELRLEFRANTSGRGPGMFSWVAANFWQD